MESLAPLDERAAQYTLNAFEDMLLASRGRLHGGMLQALYAEDPVHRYVVQKSGGLRHLVDRHPERLAGVPGAPGMYQLAEERLTELLAVQLHQVQALVHQQGVNDAIAGVITECLEWVGGTLPVTALDCHVRQRKPQAIELFRSQLPHPAAIAAFIDKNSDRFDALYGHHAGGEYIGLKGHLVASKALEACRELILCNNGFLSEQEFDQKLGVKHRLLVRGLVSRAGGLRSLAERFPQQLRWYEPPSPDQQRGIALPLAGENAFTDEAAQMAFQSMLARVMVELLDRKGGCIPAGDVKRHLRAQRTWQATSLVKAIAGEGSLASFVQSHPRHFEWRCISDVITVYYVCALRPDPPLPIFTQRCSRIDS